MLKEFVARIALMVFIFGLTNEVAGAREATRPAKQPLASGPNEAARPSSSESTGLTG